MRRDFVPVYLVTGFIESGKTTLGLTILGNERFTNGGKVLVLVCEEGEVEWDEKALEKYKGVQVILDSADELTTARLAEILVGMKENADLGKRLKELLKP